ncbi:MAG: outer membrane protein assembly factor BamD [Deltaproteobacteria bacterium]|nr:outer membrane protein assembly factor BamD [Deltaproteobacteria bacterium]
MNREKRKSQLAAGVRWLVLGLLLLGLGGCGWFSSDTKKELEGSADSLIQDGLDAYQRNSYEKAVEAFQTLKDRYPYSQYAILAELKLADSYYLNKDYELAATSYKEFERLHPANEVIPYIVFQQGMSYFKQMPTVDRDQSRTILAVQEFSRLIKSFPQSEFVTQAKANRDQALKNLATHEFLIGEFYFKQGNCQAALGRFEWINKNYPDIPPPPKMASYRETCQKKMSAGK